MSSEKANVKILKRLLTYYTLETDANSYTFCHIYEFWDFVRAPN